MINIYIVDYIGVHCGMHYYLDAFKKVLFSIPNTDIRILSNFSDIGNKKAFFINQYKGTKINKGFSLLLNLLKLYRFINKNRNAIYIYLTYGNSIDLLFMKIIAKAPHHLIDIHEAIAQDIDSNVVLKAKFKKLYKYRIKSVISHSKRTDDFLSEYGYKQKRLSVPHFRYIFPKEYNIASIPNEIQKATDSRKINLLFFGNLNKSKGIDILIEAINQLDDNTADSINIIIAGKDFDGAIDRVALKPNRHVKVFRRHISDDELRFLYHSVDYLLLPYRKTSQSGILEMAFYFKRPIIASNVPYFRKILCEFPSFGVLAGNTSKSYAIALTNIINQYDQNHFFTEKDYARYENRTEIQTFITDFTKWIKTK